MNYISYLAGLLLVLTITSCGNDSTTEPNTDELVQSDTLETIVANEMDELMLAIDMDLENRPQIKSLRYSKEDMSSVEVNAFVDNNNVIVKMDEIQIEGPTGRIVRKQFYSNGGALFASRIIEDVRPKDKDPYFSEIVTFYDEKGKVISSKERTNQFEEFLEQEEFHPIDNKPLSMNNAMMVLNQEGPYETTFQGFVHSGPYSFLIVGADTTNGFTSALSIQDQSATINWLIKQDKAALGRKLVVNFERVIDPQGYEIQILNDVALTEKP